MKTVLRAISLITLCGFTFAALSSSGIDNRSIFSGKDDPTTGMYYLYGTKTSTIYPCTWTCFDMEPYVDVESVASVVNIRRVEEKPDTLQFLGLPGADEGKRGVYFGNFQFYDYVLPIRTFERGDEYKFYAYQNGNTFEIDHFYVGQSYKASGILDNGRIELKGRYNYRQRTFEFDLRGEKIEL